MKRLLVLFCGGLFSAAVSAATLSFDYDFEKSWQGDRWTGEWWQEPGLPEVPVVWARVLIPFGHEPGSFSFVARTGRGGRGKFPTRLVTQPRPMCDVKYEPPSAPALEPEAYFPGRSAGESVSVVKHGFRIFYLPLFPLQVKPGTGENYRVPGGELTIETHPSVYREESFRGLLVDREEVSLLVDNDEALSTYPVRASRGTADYLIIGPREYLEDSATLWLISQKEVRGINSEKVSLESIVAQGTGSDTPQKIRNTILKYYKNQGTQYVLLVGNAYQILPTKAVSVSGETIASDMYYACLDGTGTESNADLACEVAVGRAPVSSIDEWQVFISKTLRLQYLDPTDPRIWHEVNFGEKMDSNTLASGPLDKLLTGGNAGNIATTGYLPKVKPTKLYETFSSSYSAQAVIDALNAQDYYTVNHMGHANETYCMRFKDTYIPQLKNQLPFFGITQGCHPGDIRKPNWASKLVLHRDGGAGAMIANSSYGWYSPGSTTDGPSNRHHLVFYDTVFKEGIRNLGKANNRAKERLISQAQSSSTIRKVLTETNLLGDPELALKFQ